MAVKCSQCGESADDQAFYCPSCGRPLRPSAPATQPLPPLPLTRHAPVQHRQDRLPPHVVVEFTSKKWKAIQAAGVFFMLVGIALMAMWPNALTIVFSAIACGVAIYGRIGAWWDHG